MTKAPSLYLRLHSLRSPFLLSSAKFAEQSSPRCLRSSANILGKSEGALGTAARCGISPQPVMKRRTLRLASSSEWASPEWIECRLSTCKSNARFNDGSVSPWTAAPLLCTWRRRNSDRSAAASNSLSETVFTHSQFPAAASTSTPVPCEPRASSLRRMTFAA